MMGFKEQVRKDVKGVFINFAEFADWHNLNGKDTLCVISRDFTDELPLGKSNLSRNHSPSSQAVYLRRSQC